MPLHTLRLSKSSSLSKCNRSNLLRKTLNRKQIACQLGDMPHASKHTFLDAVFGLRRHDDVALAHCLYHYVVRQMHVQWRYFLVVPRVLFRVRHVLSRTRVNQLLFTQLNAMTNNSKQNVARFSFNLRDA